MRTLHKINTLVLVTALAYTGLDAQAASMALTPSSNTVSVGESFTLTWSVANLPGSIGGTGYLKFNSSILSLDSVDFFGNFDDEIVGFGVPGYTPLQLGDYDANGASGSFEIAQLHFTALQSGSQQIQIFNAYDKHLTSLGPTALPPSSSCGADALGCVSSSWLLADGNNPVIFDNHALAASVNITGTNVPVPTAVWLMLSGLLGLGRLALRKQ